MTTPSQKTINNKQKTSLFTVYRLLFTKTPKGVL